ncbi:unnamed protein product [Parajaminaea phylloscopi]
MTRGPANPFASSSRAATVPASRQGAQLVAPPRACRTFHTARGPCRSHENPLGLPRNTDRIPPSMPRRSRGGPPEKKSLPHVSKVLAVSSCKGGVGKSTVAANLALSLLNNPPEQASRRPRVGLLDLDIFGPSVPKLLGLEHVGEANLTDSGALIPMTNHGLPSMSMTYLMPPEQASSPIVWRGLMVQKAVQQLLFDVDWRASAGANNSGTEEAPGTNLGSGQDGLDVLVIDMPPGTGDIALTLTQLVKLDGAVIVSTPQEVALEDTKKGVAMFEKVGVQPTGLVLNMAHYVPPPPLPQDPLPLFGPSKPFEDLAQRLQVPVLGRLPIEPAVSYGGDAGWPVVLKSDEDGGETKKVFRSMAQQVWKSLTQATQPAE